MNIIVGAEAGYIGKHPDLGYTCSMTTLFAHDPDANSEESNVAFDPGQGNDEWNGYRFALTGCEGNPPAKFRISAVPDPDAGMKTFCTDQSGTLKFVEGGKVTACFSHGKPLGTDGGAD